MAELPEDHLARLHETPAGLDAACAEIDPRQVELVFADHPHQLGRAVALVADLLESAGSADPAPAICRDGAERRLSNDDCLRSLAALRIGSLNHVAMFDGCWGMERRGAFALDNRCLRARLW